MLAVAVRSYNSSFSQKLKFQFQLEVLLLNALKREEKLVSSVFGRFRPIWTPFWMKYFRKFSFGPPFEIQPQTNFLGNKSQKGG